MSKDIKEIEAEIRGFEMSLRTSILEKDDKKLISLKIKMLKTASERLGYAKAMQDAMKIMEG